MANVGPVHEVAEQVGETVFAVAPGAGDEGLERIIGAANALGLGRGAH
jgi:hypothetical protein